jgi:hypothetical protein
MDCYTPESFDRCRSGADGEHYGLFNNSRCLEYARTYGPYEGPERGEDCEDPTSPTD